MTTYIYALMKWTRDNKSRLAAYGEIFPGLADPVDNMLAIEKTFYGDLEALNDASRGVSSSLLDSLSRAVFLFLNIAHRRRDDILGDAEADGNAVFRDISGLEPIAFSLIRRDILRSGTISPRRGHAELEIIPYATGWKLTLKTGQAAKDFRVYGEPDVTAAGLSLRGQLEWLKADEDAVYRKIDAILDDPANWPTTAEQLEVENARLDSLAAELLGTMSVEDRELAGREAQALAQRLVALLT